MKKKQKTAEIREDISFPVEPVRRRKYNEIYDSQVVKFTINIPIETYTKITELCCKKRIHRAVWVREAIERAFDVSYTTKQMIQYEIMRHIGEIRTENHIPMIEREPVSPSDEKPEKNYHKYPGFVGGLVRNSFVRDKVRKERSMKRSRLQRSF